MAIDGAVYVNDYGKSGLNPHRPRVIEGFCENLPAGRMSVAVHIGNCAEGYYGTSDRSSGWTSVSRIMIEKYPSPQK
eukprot:m.143994 g.143994  ORF g.143994 m.143994 type:complete len:77 (+) comp38398_c1_seq3:1466-1696(+)